VTSPTAEKRKPSRERIDTDSVRIGKDVIELVTSGMYVSPVTIYREYIQNSADATDEGRTKGVLGASEVGKVDMAFDHATRSVVIRDNGIGIASRDVGPILVAVGGSQKRGQSARGFRGVGRLSGLAYCRELEFRTKVAGQASVVSLSWDCRALREKLADATFAGDVRDIISDCVFLSYEKAPDPAEHFFEVRLHELQRLRGDALLNEDLVAGYLGQVAPVPFSPNFSFATEIEKRLYGHGVPKPLSLTVAGKAVHRPFEDVMEVAGTSKQITISSVEFVEFPDVDGEPGALGWIAHHEYSRSLPVALGVRGVRARVGNLQVGEANLLDESFKEPRFNGWSIGEVHVLDRRVVPNGRRDNFEINHHYYNLMVQLGPVAAKLSHLCRSSSVARNAEQSVRNAITEIEGRLKLKRPLDRAELSKLKAVADRAQLKCKRIEDADLRQTLTRKLARLRTVLSKRTPKRGAAAVAVDEVTALISKHVTNRDQAKALLEALEKLLR